MASDGDEFERDEQAEREVADDAEEGAKQAVDFVELENEDEEKQQNNDDEKMEIDENTYDEKRDAAQRYLQLSNFLMANFIKPRLNGF